MYGVFEGTGRGIAEDGPAKTITDINRVQLAQIL